MLNFKITTLVSPAGRDLVCKGHTLKAGRHIIVAESEVYSVAGNDRILLAKCISTLAVMPHRERLKQD